MPPTNATLSTVATAGGVFFTGTTTIRFNGASNNMTVTNSTARRADRARCPANGVIYVKTDTGGCGDAPAAARTPTYAEPSSCGNLYVSGTYTRA